jgi:hypothetical protein
LNHDVHKYDHKRVLSGVSTREKRPFSALTFVTSDCMEYGSVHTWVSLQNHITERLHGTDVSAKNDVY